MLESKEYSELSDKEKRDATRVLPKWAVGHNPGPVASVGAPSPAMEKLKRDGNILERGRRGLRVPSLPSIVRQRCLAAEARRKVVQVQRQEIVRRRAAAAGVDLDKPAEDESESSEQERTATELRDFEML